MEGLTIVLIASGSGTDANAIMTAWRKGQIPGCANLSLVSTKENAGCFDKAGDQGVARSVFDYREMGQVEFDRRLGLCLAGLRADLVFLVGCVHKVPVGNIPTYNIHPADPRDHGGNKMYGLAVHIHVLEQIVDRIKRGWIAIQGPHFTYPTVHRVSPDYDQGYPLLRATVEIPQDIIRSALESGVTEELAKKLQQHVLPYEWLILPTAVNMAVRKITEERSRA